ncbi:hypothetical protein OQA88_3375 [Cercophora sp. LCS_1]
MRPIWVHGSYMKALERDVLLGALELQDELLGSTTDFNPRRPADAPALPEPTADLNRTDRDAFHVVNGLTNKSWFFHSPLQYWSGSASNIEADNDIVSTVNAKKTQSTSVNVTLRHSIVFSGKRFEERQLVAADALVITLIHLLDSPVAEQWVKRAEALAARPHDKWTIIPEDGRSMSSQLYEFQFRPMSFIDLALLSIAYSLVLVHLALSLSKLHAVKSRLGLMVTILLQITASIVSSFTVCAILKIDLSRVPSYAYPLVILSISMENSLRLINAVIMTSSSISISARIGEAFGATAHVAVANRLQNLLILLGLSIITFPGVAAFCTFAAIAIVFDFFYMATFFLSVLSVDVRQRELSELEKASLKKKKSNQPQEARSAWSENFRRFRLGEIAISTRVAGTIVVLGFVLIAQSHYASEGGRQWLHQVFSWRTRDATPPKSSLLIDIHQARSPTSWLRLQDHETAREVINVVKPWAHSYVALVYDPIVFVLKGSDRIPHTKEPYFLPAVYDFLHHEIPRFAVLLVGVVALLDVFTRHLLRDGFKKDGDTDHPDGEPLLSIQGLRRDHTLDIVKMAASPGGNLVSIGLDRVIQIWDVPGGKRSRVMSDPEVPLENPFPVLGVAIDDASKQLALLSWTRVFLWDIEKQQWGPTMQIDLGGQKPEAVFFNNKREGTLPSLVVVRKNGTMVEVQTESEELYEYVVCKTPLVLAVPFPEYLSNHGKSRMLLLTASRKSCIHLVRQDQDGWSSTEVKFVGRGSIESKGVHALIPIPCFSMYLVARANTVDLVDLDSSSIIHTFETEPMQARSLRHITSIRAQQNGLASLTLAYINSESGDLVIQTYLSEDETDVIYSYSSIEARNGNRGTWSATKVITKHIKNPGVWETVPSGSVVGVRQRPPRANGKPHLPTNGTTPVGSLRRRGSPQVEADYAASPSGPWEAWVMSHLETTCDFETRPLDSPPPGHALGIGKPDPGQLMISELGPMVKLGTMSVAVAFGNVIKVLNVGHEYFDKTRDQLGSGGDMRSITMRRRKALGASRARASY